MTTFVARSSPWRILLLVAGGIAFVALGVWIAGIAGTPPKPGREWVGWASIVFFGLCSVFGVRRLFDSSEQLRISGSGIYYKPWAEQVIPWSEITDISVWEFKRQKSLILHLAHPERYPSTTLLGKMARANRMLTGGDVAVSLTGMDRSFAEALAAVESFRLRA